MVRIYLNHDAQDRPICQARRGPVLRRSPVTENRPLDGADPAALPRRGSIVYRLDAARGLVYENGNPTVTARAKRYDGRVSWDQTLPGSLA